MVFYSLAEVKIFQFFYRKYLTAAGLVLLVTSTAFLPSWFLLHYKLAIFSTVFSTFITVR